MQSLRDLVGGLAEAHEVGHLGLASGERLAAARGARQPLTRRETEVANFVRLGKTTDEIAETLHISRSAVSFHRANVRRKMGLSKGGPRLSTHLAGLGRS